jgi:hypothetical protein
MDLKNLEGEQIDAEVLNSLAVTMDNFRYAMKLHFQECLLIPFQQKPEQKKKVRANEIL